MSASDRDARIQAILDSPAYRMAEADGEFLESDAARASRLALEFMRADFYLREHRIESTVVVFGSSRSRAPETAQQELQDAERGTADAAGLARARANLSWSRYYEEARSLARILSTSQNGKPRRDFVIVTGGGPGIMEAKSRCDRVGRAERRLQHRFAARAAPESVHHAVTGAPLSLLRLAQDALSAACEGARRVSGWLRHAR